MDRLTARLLSDAGVKPIVANVPEGVEVCRRSNAQRAILILINHNTEEEHIALPSAMRDLIGSAGTVSSVDLPKYGVAVLEE